MVAAKPERLFTEEEVSIHDTLGSAWVIHNGGVYDVTEFLQKHPGGADIIIPYAGTHVDDTMLDEAFHVHSKAAFSLLETYKIGKTRESLNNNKTKNENLDEDLNLSGWKESQVDWNKAMLPQVHRLGYDYKTWVHSPVDYKLKLFRSDFLELFSKTPWYFIPIIWIPITLYSLVVAWNMFQLRYSNTDIESLSFLSTLLTFPSTGIVITFLAGVFLWSIIEYVLHRFLFHLEPKGDSPFLITLHFFLHGQHHKVPFDSGRLVFPPVAASFFCFLFYLMATTIFDEPISQGIFAGGIAGYVMYDLTHYYLHHGSPRPGTYFYRLKQYHIAHHFEDQSNGFGISSKFWDYPFNTTFKNKVT